ncbi:beta-glucosidase 24-like [Trifolium pratense]|uniref:beta-glucosidase 24-like n=1 Tax=Trifolium pratense TaxID=57577 RepID=UPI001E692017|nr:beta-glucosidase 24-like [Trifolium pratense]
MHDPRKPHVIAAKRIFRYLKGTLDYGLLFHNGTNGEGCALVGYSDSDWCGDITDRRSTSDYVFKVNNAAISWCTKKQLVTALSSYEAEYIEGTFATCQAMWLNSVMKERQKMKMLSSLKFILTILSIVVLLSNLSQAQGLLFLFFYTHLKKKSSLRGDLLAGSRPPAPIQIGEEYHISFKRSQNSSSFPKRASFPSDFLFGVGSSSLQIEGDSLEGGGGKGVWEDIVERHKERFVDADKVSTMIEHYKRYKEDVKHLKYLGVNSYGMSISWSRILPDGTLKGGINKEGINFYNNLINELLANGIEPFVTIVHFDYPVAIQQKIGGFLNHTIVKYYKDYCNLLFKTYGDRVKHWTTTNEPQVVAIYKYMHGYDNDAAEPCQDTKICSQAYTVLHNFLICHATATHLYRQKFQETQRGDIGIVISYQGFVPYSSNPQDVAAAQRLIDFWLGWILEPLFYGDYPQIMRKLVGHRLPKFTKKEKHMIKGSADFIGINYYTSQFARYEPNRTKINGLDNFDALATTSEEFNIEGEPLGHKDQYSGRYVYPKGLYDVLIFIKEKYKNPNIYITENGTPSSNNPNPLKDEHRIAYITEHINATKAAIDNGVKVRGYFVWTAFDTFEFEAGYSGHWGLYHIDFNNSLKRIPKASAEWYRNFLKSNGGHYNTIELGFNQKGCHLSKT